MPMTCSKMPRPRPEPLAIGIRPSLGQKLRSLGRNVRTGWTMHYLATYLLNPYYLFKDIVTQEDTTKNGLIHCLDVYYPKPNTQDVVVNINYKSISLETKLMGSAIATRYW